MQEFIDKEELLFNAPVNFRFLSTKQFKKVLNVLRSMPTTRSGEIAVLCKDCKFAAKNEESYFEIGKAHKMLCLCPETPFFGHRVKECDFCCYGKRKED